MAKPADKKHFQIYDINLKVRQQFVGLCKLEGKSASRTIENMMVDYVQEKKSILTSKDLREYVSTDDE